MTRDDMVILGRQADALMTSPAFQAAVADFRESLAERFFASKPEDMQGRERLFSLRLALDAVIGNLQSYMLNRQQLENEQNDD